ncbi:MAG TPA: urocanate hydratase [Bacteroidales bacterium]|nr:urocanate hydratase [Bacteroidales bacterium]
MNDFQQAIRQGIPSELPEALPYDLNINHAPPRRNVLSITEKKLAVSNALRYFPKKWHAVLAKEFAGELEQYGRIYMYRFRPRYKMYARPIKEYPAHCQQAAAIMLMIQNNLDPNVAQHPHELITYGGNGAVFQNWAQYLLTMKYLSEMTCEQTLVMYSGHPMGLFPSHKDAPRVVITNGMMIPNYSSLDDYDRYNALGVTQYGQMTAGSYMYIGPQGIVHGTTITLLNAKRIITKHWGKKKDEPVLFVSSGLGGMSGAQPKASNIAGVISVVAEVNPKAAQKRFEQGWVNELVSDIDVLVGKVKRAINDNNVQSFGYIGNIVDVWERFYIEGVKIDLGSDQTSLHNPFNGGYYPVDLTFEQSNKMMSTNPEKFKEYVYASLRRQVEAINKHTQKGTYFFDYGNAFLLESARAGADVKDGNKFKYPSYVEDIMGPYCFDYGFGPFRWVCTSGKPEDLQKTDEIATVVLEELMQTAPTRIRQQMADNIQWIRGAQENKLVVGSQARILYADAWGRIKIAQAFNNAIASGELSAPVVLGRDHHDVSGTDSPFRETSNIYDGSKFTADMAIQNVIGDSFRGATWVSIHNGGGVGWGEVINGGFGMLLDGSKDAERRLKQMLYWDVNNGISRRSWARNDNAMFTIKRAMSENPQLKITMPVLVDKDLINDLFQ